MSKDQKFVYFVRPIGMDGPIKIGCSTKPLDRLAILSAWSPFPLELIGSVPGTFSDEARLHRRFSDLHTRKEWFMSSPLLRQTIELILSGVSVKDACKQLTLKKPIRNQSRPVRTPDRELFLSYGTRVRKAARDVYDQGEHKKHYVPSDVRKILHDWRCDRFNGHTPITPSSEQFARIEEFIANPREHCVSFADSYGHPARGAA